MLLEVQVPPVYNVDEVCLTAKADEWISLGIVVMLSKCFDKPA
jgi:hypothetical protein